jgi:hypothetical protein
VLCRNSRLFVTSVLGSILRTRCDLLPGSGHGNQPSELSKNIRAGVIAEQA